GRIQSAQHTGRHGARSVREGADRSGGSQAGAGRRQESARQPAGFVQAGSAGSPAGRRSPGELRSGEQPMRIGSGTLESTSDWLQSRTGQDGGRAGGIRQVALSVSRSSGSLL